MIDREIGSDGEVIDDGLVPVNVNEHGIKVVPRMTLLEYQEKLEAKGLDPLTGFEVPDDTELAPPLGFIKQPSMMELIAQMVRSEALRQAVEREGFETFEEADDFEVDDPDGEPLSDYQNEDGFEPVPEVQPGPAADPAAPPPVAPAGPANAAPKAEVPPPSQPAPAPAAQS